ncbi:MAG: copper chaperone PCu(A)C [SAR324 cluster bacterium]|nr:copper chaperone PCu(A)C [SAR324 cluster bacterium]
MKIITNLKFKALAIAAILAFLGGCSSLVATKDSNIKVESAHFLPMPAGSATSMGTLVISNSGNTADQLLKATAGAAYPIEIHKFAYQAGSLKMVESDVITIPAKSSLELTAKGYHLLLVNPTQRVNAGNTIQVTLTFSNSGEIVIPFQVTEKKPLTKKEAMAEKEASEIVY